MVDEKTKNMILAGEAVLGIELGSTRIKAVLVNDQNEPIAGGGSDWKTPLQMDTGPTLSTMSGKIWQSVLQT